LYTILCYSRVFHDIPYHLFYAIPRHSSLVHNIPCH